MVIREAIKKTDYNWKRDGSNLPEAIMKIMQTTGKAVDDPGSMESFRRLDLGAALDHVYETATTPGDE